MSKYVKAVLPPPDQAIALAESYEEWARGGYAMGLESVSRTYELTALLLRYYAKNEKELQYGKISG